VSEAIAFYTNADPHAALYYKNRETTSCSWSTPRATSKVRSPSVHGVHSQPDRPVRTSLPRYSRLQLTSAKILSQRSAVLVVVSRATKPSSAKISWADKERLLRIAKRPRKGPLNAIMDPTEFGVGNAAIDVSHAVKHSGGHDLWDVPAVEEIVPDGLETVRRRTIVVRYPCPRGERGLFV
jgi:hypothetical protein